MHRVFVCQCTTDCLRELLRASKTQCSHILPLRRRYTALTRFSSSNPYCQALHPETVVSPVRSRAKAVQHSSRSSLLAGSLWQWHQRHHIARNRTIAAELSTGEVSSWPNLSLKSISAGEVHLWWLFAEEVTSPDLLDQYLGLLSPAEQEHVAQGASLTVQKEWLLARVLVRTVLARYCGELASPALLQFESNSHGKPSLVAAEDYDVGCGQLHFNLSHTDSVLGCAVTRGAQIGLDVEDSHRLTRTDPIKLARRRFSPLELAKLQEATSVQERARLFMRLWTLKEAYVKATGRGISAHPGLKAFSFQLLPNKPGSRVDLEPPSDPQGRQADKAEHASTPWKGNKENVPPFRSDTITAEAGGSKQTLKGGYIAALVEGNNGALAQGVADRPGGEVAQQWGSHGRAPFRIRFQPPEGEHAAWRAMLLEVAGNHTAALCMEVLPQEDASNGAREAISGPPDAALTIFKIVPLVREEVWSRDACCVIATS